MTTMNFRGAAKRLQALDFSRAGAEIGVGEDELHAFAEVESRGSGFDALGRPKILFEPAVFYRCLPAAKRKQGIDAGLAWPKWRPGAYGKESEQYGKLERAVAIDQTAALKACSWGMFQILGENHHAAGYDTVQDMVASFMEGEPEQLTACIHFLVTNGIDDDLKAHRWETVARVYNGPGYAEHGYHTRLAAAYRKWARIPDAEASAGLGLLGSAKVQPKLGKPKIESIQSRLRALGYFEVGKVDGKMGPNTGAALFKFQTINGLNADGTFGPDTDRALFGDDAKPSPVSPTRAGTTVADLREQGSTEIKVADNVETTGKALGIGSVATGALAWAQDQGLGLFDYFGRMKDLLGPKLLVVLLIAAGLAAWLYLHRQAKRAKDARVQDERLGLTSGRPQPATQTCLS